MECTSIKFELFWRKISRKDGCKGVSENAQLFLKQKTASRRTGSSSLACRLSRMFAGLIFPLAVLSAVLGILGILHTAYPVRQAHQAFGQMNIFHHHVVRNNQIHMGKFQIALIPAPTRRSAISGAFVLGMVSAAI